MCDGKESKRKAYAGTYQEIGWNSFFLLSPNAMNRLFSDPQEDFGIFETVKFEQQLILEQSVQLWPICDVLIAFYSDGDTSPWLWSCLHNLLLHRIPIE